MFRFTVGICCSLLMLSSCQSYRERPLALPERIQEWAAQDQAYLSLKIALANDASPFNLDDGIQIAEAEAIALFFNPQLRQARLQTFAHKADAEHASTWSDPELGIDGAYILEEVDDQFIGGVSLGFTIPLSGRKRAAAALAAAQFDESKQAVIVAEWALIQDIRQRWCQAAAIQTTIHLHEQFLTELNVFRNLSSDLLNAQLLEPSELQALELFYTDTQQQLLVLKAELKQQSLILSSLLGLHPDHTWNFQFALATADVPNISTETLIKHPNIKLQSLHYLVAEHQLHLEIRRQYPDLHFGFGLASEDGEARSTFGLGLAPLAIWNRNKQGIQRAKAERAVMALQAETALRTLIYRYSHLNSELQSTTELLAFIQDKQLPLAQAQITTIRQSISTGKLDVMLLIESLSHLFELQIQQNQLITQRQQATIALDGLRVPFSKQENNHE